MLLRSLTNHVKDQNWLAIFIDFLIVVLGILIAFQITEWNENQNEKTSLKNAETALKSDLFTIYFNAQERMVLTECRIASLKQLGEQLLKPTTLWQGVPLEGDSNEKQLAFNTVLHSPSRSWVSTIWDAELARGTFNNMDKTRRETMETIFSEVKYVEKLNESIHVNQAKLKVLAYSIELSNSDRLRYFEVVSAIDQESRSIERASSLLAEHIESLRLEFKQEERQFFREILTEHNKVADSIYGECRMPMHIPFILEP